MVKEALVRCLVFVAEVNLGETSLEVVSDKVAGIAEVADLLDEVDGLAVGDSRDAREGVGRDVVSGVAD